MFGKSVFESVLERLRMEEEEELRAQEDGQPAADDLGPDLPRGPLPAFAVFTAAPAFATGNAAAAAYRDISDDDPPAPAAGPDAAPGPYREALTDRLEPAAPEQPPRPPAPTAPPPHLLRTAPQEIAADLGLDDSQTRAQLAEIRRAFARDNHPDTAPPELRANATRRMMIANMLIDETLRRIKAEERLGLRP